MRGPSRLVLSALAVSFAGCTVATVEHRPAPYSPPAPPPYVVQQRVVYRYFGAHVIPAAYGSGWCFVDGTHDHEYPPDNLSYYRYESGIYYYSAPVVVTYYDLHPDPYGHWCYLQGPHTHDYFPLREHRNYYHYDRGHYFYRASGSAPRPPADYHYEPRGNSTYTRPPSSSGPGYTYSNQGGQRSGTPQTGGYSYPGGNSQQHPQTGSGAYTYGNDKSRGQPGNNAGGQTGNNPGSPRPGSPTFGNAPMPSAGARSPMAPATPPRPLAPSVAPAQPPPPAGTTPLPPPRTSNPPPPAPSFRPPPTSPPAVQPAPPPAMPTPPKPAAKPAPPKAKTTSDKNDANRKLRW